MLKITFVCLCVNVCACRSEDRLQEQILSTMEVPGVKTQAIRLEPTPTGGPLIFTCISALFHTNANKQM